MTSFLRIPVNEMDHVRGMSSARAVLVEYGDFQCPYCAMAYPKLERLLSEFGADLCFVFRHFPLRTVHPFAELAALSAEAAHLQQKFWPMHHMLFENYDDLSEMTIVRLARELGLDLQSFTEDISRPQLKTRVSSDFDSGIRSGVNGTPTLFLNGSRYQGPPEYSAYRHAVMGLLDGQHSSERR